VGLLAGKVALVTGAGNGIGRGIARVLAAEGAAVLVTDIDAVAADHVAADIARGGGQACAQTLDVRDPAAATAAARAAVDRLGGLDILVANAGTTARCPFLEMPQAFFQDVLRTNLEGCFLSCQAAARVMVERGRGGRIVTISSNSCIFGGRGRAAYSASKAGIIALTQTMAIELAPHGILVNCVCPGPTRTQRTTTDVPGPAFTARMSLPRFGLPEEVGQAVAFLASDRCSFTTGHTLCVDGGLTVTGIMDG
jgi:NAD(P)-dependent dehydrogenase (short-subunit alcohol dehydrogenase family)